MEDPRKPSNRAYFRAPKSDEPFAVTYNTIQSTLEQYLEARYESFGVYLIVACYGNPATLMIQVPFLLIGTPPSQPLPPVHTLPSVVRDCGLGIVLCAFHPDLALAESTNRRLPRKHLCTGIEVGTCKDNACTTLGAIIRRQNDSYIGITSGHLFEKGNPDDVITQPSLASVDRELKTLRDTKLMYDEDIRMAKNPAVRDRFIIAQGEVEQEIKDTEQFVGKSASETQVKIRAGKVSRWEFKVVRVDAGRRIADYTLFDIDASRNPMSELWKFAAPSEGVLGDGPWAPLRDWGKLKYDVQVRKNGMKTRYSFGVVAGISSSMTFPGSSKASREFYVMPESEFDTRRFADRGDSGAAVISKSGLLVGFVMCKISLRNCKIVIDPETENLDIKIMEKYRNTETGKIDWDKVWFQQYSKVEVVSVMSSEVLEQRTGIRSMGDLVIDT